MAPISTDLVGWAVSETPEAAFLSILIVFILSIAFLLICTTCKKWVGAEWHFKVYDFNLLWDVCAALGDKSMCPQVMSDVKKQPCVSCGYVGDCHHHKCCKMHSRTALSSFSTMEMCGMKQECGSFTDLQLTYENMKKSASEQCEVVIILIALSGAVCQSFQWIKFNFYTFDTLK